MRSVISTCLVSLFALAALAAPVEKRDLKRDETNVGTVETAVDNAGSVNDPVADLLINVVGGLEGGATVIDGVVDQLGGTAKRQDSGLAGTLVDEASSVDDPLVDVLVNVGGALEGTATVVDGIDYQLGNNKKRQNGDQSEPDSGLAQTLADEGSSVNDPAVDLAVNVVGGLEGAAEVVDGIIQDV